MNGRVSRFEKGSSTYTCAGCEKLTRDTGEGERNVGLCARCYAMAGDDNAVADGQMTEAEFFEVHGEHSSWHREEQNEISNR